MKAALGPPFSFMEIKMAETKPKAGTVPVKLLYDFWTEEERIKKGTILDVPVKTAKELIDAGKAERADPLPEE